MARKQGADMAMALRIRAERLAQGITMRALAQALNCTIAAVSKIERGEHRITTVQAGIICGVLGKSPNWLFGLPDPHRALGASEMGLAA